MRNLVLYDNDKTALKVISVEIKSRFRNDSELSV